MLLPNMVLPTISLLWRGWVLNTSLTMILWSQIIGVHDHAEKDEIVKSVMHLKNAEIEEGYTKEAVVSRQVSQKSYVTQ